MPATKVTTPNTPAAPNDKLAAFLLAEAINNAPAWMPGENEDQAIMHGTVIGLAMGESKQNDFGQYPIVIYKLDSNCGQYEAGTHIKVHAFHTLLRTQLMEAGTKIGVEQMVSYRGKRKKNNPTEDEIKRGLDEYHLTYVQNVGAEFTAVAEGFTFEEK